MKKADEAQNPSTEAPKRGRGRPKSAEGAMSGALRQKLYRMRHRADLQAKTPVGMRKAAEAQLRRMIRNDCRPSELEGALQMSYMLGLLPLAELPAWRARLAKTRTD
jgi:hypothetical protein